MSIYVKAYTYFMHTYDMKLVIMKPFVGGNLMMSLLSMLEAETLIGHNNQLSSQIIGCDATTIQLATSSNHLIKSAVLKKYYAPPKIICISMPDSILFSPGSGTDAYSASAS